MSLPLPLGDRVLVEQFVTEVKSSIVMPEESKESLKRPKGTVLSVGNGTAVVALGLVEGDMVYFADYSGERVMFEEKEYVLLRPDELLAKEAKA